MRKKKMARADSICTIVRRLFQNFVDGFLLDDEPPVRSSTEYRALIQSLARERAVQEKEHHELLDTLRQKINAEDNAEQIRVLRRVRNLCQEKRKMNDQFDHLNIVIDKQG